MPSDVGPHWYRWMMPYFQVAMPEPPLLIGDETPLLIAALMA